ncbi:T9SS type A sorting domain-containing protein [Nafulsella turpanensis]|uniref:T9SS type A sorting domain-containing protein n=1 Tax=Nafulsella turpanensis TaxID=1265690 RepID=UPI00034BA742|nr:T9SS type A sorting domain-containing protein [Nafulsella turpanensis]
MKIFFTTLGLGSLMLLFFNLDGHAQLSLNWEKTIGGNQDDNLSSVILTHDGNYLLAGTSSSKVSYERTAAHKGGKDYWIVKTDAQGNIIWDHAYGGRGDDELHAVLPTEDGGFLLAGNSSSGMSGEKESPSQGGTDYWLVKTDASGRLLWEQTYGGNADDRLQAITPAPGGGYLLSGYSASGVSGSKSETGNGGTDFWVIRIDAEGLLLWDKTFGGSEDEQLLAATAAPDGSFLLGGTSLSGVGGDKTEASRGDMDFWVIRIDAAGRQLWDRTLGGSGYDGLQAVEAIEGGGFLVGGFSHSDASGDKSHNRISDQYYYSDYWFLRLDEQGNILWDNTLGGEGYDRLTAILPAPGGGYLLGGYSFSNSTAFKSENSQGSSDYWLIKVDENGKKLWDKGFGSAGSDLLTDMLSTSNGSYLLAGYSWGYASGDKSSDRREISSDFWILEVEESEGTPPVLPRPEIMLAWDKAYAPSRGLGQGELTSVAATADGGYLLGETTAFKAGFWTDYGIIKLDASGNQLWRKTYGGNQQEELSALVALPDGGFLLAGTSKSGISGDKTEENRSRRNYPGFVYMGPDYWVIRIDAEGNKLWDKTFGSSGNDYLIDAIPTADGGFLLGGHSFGGATADKSAVERGTWVVRIDAYGNKLWDNAFNGSGSVTFTSFTEAADGSGFLLGGSTLGGADSRGSSDYWVLHIDQQGEQVWERTFGGKGFERVGALAAPAEGGFLIGGSSTSGASGDKSQENRGHNDFWVLRVDASGNILWEKTFGGNLWDNFRDMVASRDGGFVLAGESVSEISYEKTEESRGQADYWALKIDAEGHVQWDKTLGGNGFEELVSIAEAQDGGFLLTGTSRSGLSGDKSADEEGETDYWLSKITEPSQGMLSGGGRFDSPEGAYFPEPFMHGRAQFGLGVRSQESGSVNGTLSFHLPEALLNFRSHQLDWLAIAGEKAMLTGSGILNREEGYRFFLSVDDRNLTTRAAKDAFRLMIWGPDGRMVYDNQRGNTWSVPATITISAGNISVMPLQTKHKAKQSGKWQHLRQQPDIRTVLEGFKAYPMPLNQEGLWLLFPEANHTRTLRIGIYDMQGKARARTTVHLGRSAEQHFWKLDHQGWPAGVYILRISGNGLLHQQKLIK